MDSVDVVALLEDCVDKLDGAATDLKASPEKGEDSAMMASVFEVLERSRNATSAAVAAALEARDAGVLNVGFSEKSDIIIEAQGLRNEALHARDMAEADLLSARKDREGLLKQLRGVTEERSRLTQEREDLHITLSAREKELEASCEAVEAEVRAERKRLETQTRRLLFLGDSRHALGVRQRRLERHLSNSLVLNVVAKELLEQHHGTEAYLKDLRERMQHADELSAHAEKECMEKLEQLRAGWQDKQDWYVKESAKLEATLQRIEHEHEEKQRAANEERTRKLKEQREKTALHIQEDWYVKQSAKLEATLQRIEHEHEEQREKTALHIQEERDSELRRLEMAFNEKRARLHVEAAEEQIRWEALRKAQKQRTAALTKEVSHFRELLNDVRRSYFWTARHSSLAPRTPCTQMAGRQRSGHLCEPVRRRPETPRTSATDDSLPDGREEDKMAVAPTSSGRRFAVRADLPNMSPLISDELLVSSGHKDSAASMPRMKSQGRVSGSWFVRRERTATEVSGGIDVDSDGHSSGSYQQT